MNRTTKNVLLGCGIGCVVVAVLGAVLALVLWAKVLRPAVSRASREREAGPVGVSVGSGFVASRVFADNLQTGPVTDIAAGKFDPNPKVAFVVAGREGATFLARDATPVSSLTFADRYSRVDVIDVEKDGTCEFMNRGSWTSAPLVLNHDGTVRWRSPAPGGADDMAAGDVDGDGYLEFAVGMNGGGGVHLLDRAGKERWRQSDGNVWHVEIGDVTGTGRPSIVHTNAGGRLKVRDATGRVLSGAARAGWGGYANQFALAPWPSPTATPLRLLVPGDDTVQVVDAASKVLAKLDAPGASRTDPIRATYVQLQSNLPPHLALLITRQLSNQAILYIYDAQARLVYRETLSEPAAALALLPLPNTSAQALLVGGKGRVLQYVAAH